MKNHTFATHSTTLTKASLATAAISLMLSGCESNPPQTTFAYNEPSTSFSELIIDNDNGLNSSVTSSEFDANTSPPDPTPFEDLAVNPAYNSTTLTHNSPTNNGNATTELPTQPDANTLSFQFDKADLSEEIKNTLAEHAHYLIETPTAKLTINGHTDQYGPALYNKHLSIKRAESVANYLESLGVQSEQLLKKGWGEEAALDDSISAKSQRRVELNYSDENLRLTLDDGDLNNEDEFLEDNPIDSSSFDSSSFDSSSFDSSSFDSNVIDPNTIELKKPKNGDSV